MRTELTIDPSECRPAIADVLETQELPDYAALSLRTRATLDDALAAFATLARPTALVETIDIDDFLTVYAGEGRNESPAPLEVVAAKAQHLALFVATLGEPIDVRVREAFGCHDLALGYLLDAVASAAAERLVDQLAERRVGFDEQAGHNRLAVLPYSPGYCGWHVTGQRALFGKLRPGSIGVTLNPSCLMSSLKSVSGVLVAGDPSIHRFRPAYPFCDVCTTRHCRERIASLLRSDSSM